MKKLFLPLLFCSGLIFGQSQVQTAPDCSITATLTGAGATTTVSAITCSFNQTGVWVWTAAYYVDGFSAVSVTVQSAQDVSGSPSGSWSTMSGVNTGIGCGANPCTTATSNFIVLNNYSPWVRVILNSVTGSGFVRVTLYGSRNPGSGGGSGTGGGGGSGCTAPCQVYGSDTPGSAPTEDPLGISLFDGTDARRALSDTGGRLLTGAYPSQNAVSLSSSGLTQIIAASSGKITTVSYLELAFVSAVTVQFEYGTGSNCGSGTTALTGVLQGVVTYTRDTPWIVPSGNALCVNLGSSVTGGGSVTFAQP